MKIKKVKIQAFKSYLNEEDSTFDFRWCENTEEVANIISIFAPNGFGKTSFYDAVDYCYTRNITRYIRDDNVKKQNSKNANNQRYIIRNMSVKESKRELDTKVTIITDDNSEIVSPIVKYNHKGNDYKFEDANTPDDRKYFRDLMLSQDAIDAFLRETDPAERFNKFSTKQVNALSKLSNDRKIIQHVLSEVENKIKNITSQEKVLKDNLSKYDLDNEIMEKLNHSILACNSLGYEIELATEPSSYKKLVLGSFDLAETEKSKIEKILKSQKILESSIENSNTITNSIVQLNKIQNEFKEIEQALTNKRLISIIDKSLANSEAVIVKYKENINKINGCVSFIDQFFKHYHNRVKLISQRNKSDSLIKTLYLKKENNSQEINNLVDLINKKISMKNQLVFQEKTAAEKFKQIAAYENELINSTQSLNDLTKKLVNLESSRKNVTIKINSLKTATIDNYLEPKLFDFDVNNLNQLYRTFHSNNQEINELSKKIIFSQQQLEKLEQHDSDIIKILSLGREIISYNSSSECPLCSHVFDSFVLLKQAIEKNTSVKVALSDNLKYINDLNDRKANLEKLNVSLKKQSSDIISNYLKLEEDSFKEKSNSCFNLKQEIDKEKENLSSLSEKIALLRSDTLSLSQINYLNYIRSEIGKIDADIASKEKVRDDLLTNNQNKDKKIAREIANRNIFNKEIFSIEILEEYSCVIDFAENNSIEISSDKEIFLSQLENIRKKTVSHLSITEELAFQESERKDKLYIQISPNLPSAEEKLNTLRDEAQLKINSLTAEMSIYIKEFGDLQLMTASLPELIYIAKGKINALIKKESESRIRMNNLIKLSQLAEKATSLSDGLKISRELELLKKTKNNISMMQKLFSNDIDKIDNEINVSIKEFFYVDLINEIYNAIDPHPDFKNINFKYVPNKKPELLITVSDSASKNKISPALHFSSAQINVLSLSIFLAKALNTRNNEGEVVDCIFIDDPIQSMDAINILSVIDLLRNVAIRFDKQLIVSTHDENFHELLKKKIPSNLFKSKFLRLESFGKVSEDL